MSPNVKYGILGTVLVVLLILGGLQLSKTRSEGLSPDTPETNTKWICAKCNHSFDLTARQFDAWVADPQKARPMSGDPKGSVFKCPQCGEFEVVRAAYCRGHDGYYPDINPKDGSPQVCQQCAGGKR